MANLPYDELIWVVSCRHIVYIANVSQRHNLRKSACRKGGDRLGYNLGSGERVMGDKYTMIGYRGQTEMSGPDVQCNLNPRGLFAPHSNIGKLLALFGLQLCCTEMLES